MCFMQSSELVFLLHNVLPEPLNEMPAIHLVVIIRALGLGPKDESHIFNEPALF